MIYEELRGIFDRTGTLPICGTYASQYPRVCLNTALTIEKFNLTKEQIQEKLYRAECICDDEFIHFERGWEGNEVDNINEEFLMGAELKLELTERMNIMEDNEIDLDEVREVPRGRPFRDIIEDLIEDDFLEDYLAICPYCEDYGCERCEEIPS